jgi:predicted permease
MAKILNLVPWRRRRMDQDLGRELRHHIELRVKDLTRSGLSEVEARRQAALEFGRIAHVQEDVRDTWIWRWADDLGRDVRYGSRALLRSPVFTVTAVLSLALGIGANAGIFSLIDQVLLRLLPVKEAERLVRLDWSGNPVSAQWGSGSLLSYPLCRDLQKQTRFFDGVFCRHPTNVNFSTGEQHDPIRAEIISGSYFPVLGVRPELGRLIDQSDDVNRDAHPVVVLSYTYWKHNLGGAPDVVGRKVLINNYPMTVIGVAPASFRGIDVAEVPALWVPAMMKRIVTPEFDRLFDRRAFWMHVFGRLKPGVTAEQAKVGLQPWFKVNLESETQLESFPSLTSDQRRSFLASALDVVPGVRGSSNLRAAMEKPLLLLMGGTLLLLLLASLNVAGLLLARGAARSREVATRLALGASRGRITRQLLVESTMITLGGGLLGLVAAPVVSRALISLLSQDADLSSRINRNGILLALVVSIVVGGLCALAPALQTGRIPLIGALKDRSHIATAGGVRLRKALVIGQMAFTLILLIGAGLFVQTLERLRDKGPGFASSSLLMFRVDPPSIGYSEQDAERAMRNVLRSVQELPGLESAAVANAHMLGGGGSSSVFSIQFGERIVTNRVHYMRVGPGFFATLGTQLVAGRDFNESDVRKPNTPATRYHSAIVNERLARRYFGERSPIGHRLGFGNRPSTTTDIEIIGVVRDFSRLSLREETEMAFFPFWASDAGDGTFYVRMRGRPEAAFRSIREAVARVDRSLPVLRLTTFDDQMEVSLRGERMLATLSIGFGVIALLLSVVGLYGVMSFVVTHRTQEIGVRRALGATRIGAVWLIIRDALFMIGAGTAIALPVMWALTRLVEAHLFGVRAVDGPTVAVASCLLALVALGAAMLPAWRAGSVSPTQAMRFE